MKPKYKATGPQLCTTMVTTYVPLGLVGRCCVWATVVMTIVMMSVVMAMIMMAMMIPDHKNFEGDSTSR